MKKMKKSSRLLLLWIVLLVVIGIGNHIYLVQNALVSNSSQLPIGHIRFVIGMIMLCLLPILLYTSHYAKLENNKKVLIISRILSVHHIIFVVLATLILIFNAQ